MLFKKKKQEEQESEEAIQDVEYSPEELQLIHNLVEDFEKAPGQISVPFEETEEEETPAGDEEELTEDEAASGESEAPAFKPRPVETKAADLGEFDDLAEMDLDSLGEEPAAKIPESPQEDAGEESPAEAEVLPEESPADEFDLGSIGDMGDMGEPAGQEVPTETESDLGPGFDLGPETTEQAEEDLTAGLDIPEVPAGDEPAPTTEAADEFSFDDLGGDIGGELETPEQTPAATPAADEFSFDDLGADIGGELETPEQTPAATPAADEFSFDDFGTEIGGDLETPGSAGTEDDLTPKTAAETSDEFSFDDLGGDIGGDIGEPVSAGPAMDEFDLSEPAGKQEEIGGFNFDDIAPPSLDDVSPEIISRPRKKSALSDELSALAAEHVSEEISNTQLAALRANLKSFTPGIRHTTINALLENRLKKEDSSILIQRLIEGANELEIKRFLEEKLGKGFVEAEPETPSQRPIIVSRKAYTEKGIHRRERMVKITKFAIFFVPLSLLTFAGVYLFGIKKMLYNRDIAKGREIILSQNFMPSDISRAETHFEKAVKRYPKNSKAYLQFADAYRRKGYYDNSFEKLFGKVKLNAQEKAIRYEGQELNDAKEFWGLLQKVPIIRYADKNRLNLLMNNISFTLEKPGAYIIAHLDRKEDEAIILYALGDFHSSPARKFVESPYRNNRLGIDYFNRILNFKVTTPIFEAEKFISRAILGIGDVYYHNADYNKAHDYFDKIIRKDPYDINGQTGMLKTLIKMYESPNFQISDDPRLIIQQHSLIKHNYKIEKKLPLYILAKLARFYIDLPDKDDLRINYNTSPVDGVNNKALKSRAEELLNIIYNKTDEDIYGNKISGKTFAEGYYQRGRYYRYVVKEYRMAMSQFEYAYKYDPDHFMALNDRAEILMELNDYEGARKHLEIASEKLSNDLLNRLGDRPEDETLLEADRGIVTFNLARTLYLSRVQNLDEPHDWLRIQETDRFETTDEYGKEALIAMLDQVDMFLDKAEVEGLRGESPKTELAYYRGWIHYLKNDYARALYFWQSVSPAWDKKLPNLELAKSYALYYLGTKNPSDRKRYMETSLSHLYYLQSKYEPLADKISRPKENNKTHDIVFSKMTIIENNMGAIFEMMGQEDAALMHYQKSIQYSKKINKENEVANLNMRLAFKRKNLEDHEINPLIMDFISPYLIEDSL